MGEQLPGGPCMTTICLVSAALNASYWDSSRLKSVRGGHSWLLRMFTDDIFASGWSFGKPLEIRYTVSFDKYVGGEMSLFTSTMYFSSGKLSLPNSCSTFKLCRYAYNWYQTQLDLHFKSNEWSQTNKYLKIHLRLDHDVLYARWYFRHCRALTFEFNLELAFGQFFGFPLPSYRGEKECFEIVGWKAHQRPIHHSLVVLWKRFKIISVISNVLN